MLGICSRRRQATAKLGSAVLARIVGVEAAQAVRENIGVCRSKKSIEAQQWRRIGWLDYVLVTLS